MSECETLSGTCPTTTHSDPPAHPAGLAQRCPCGGGCGGDPVACAMNLWVGSFFQAMRQAQVEILKAKLQKAWGSKMEKAADAVLEAMETQWGSILAGARAKTDLRTKLQGLWQEGKSHPS